MILRTLYNIDQTVYGVRRLAQGAKINKVKVEEIDIRFIKGRKVEIIYTCRLDPEGAIDVWTFYESEIFYTEAEAIEFRKTLQ